MLKISVHLYLTFNAKALKSNSFRAVLHLRWDPKTNSLLIIYMKYLPTNPLVVMSPRWCSTYWTPSCEEVMLLDEGAVDACISRLWRQISEQLASRHDATSLFFPTKTKQQIKKRKWNVKELVSRDRVSTCSFWRGCWFIDSVPSGSSDSSLLLICTRK